MKGCAMEDKLLRLLDDFEHECFMLRVEASETRARDDVVRKAYEQKREKTAQAIAAALGGGKLTAEQVREAIFHGSAYASFNGARYYVNGISMQAIADELNAKLGGGECEFIGDAKYPPKCSACGWQAGTYDCEWLEDGEFEYDGKFCKECGAKVKAVKR